MEIIISLTYHIFLLFLLFIKFLFILSLHYLSGSPYFDLIFMRGFTTEHARDPFGLDGDLSLDALK